MPEENFQSAVFSVWLVKSILETGFHLTSKIFAAISLNIFFLFFGTCVCVCGFLCVCVKADICMPSALFVASGQKTTMPRTERAFNASPRVAPKCCKYFKAPSYIIINQRPSSYYCCCCCCSLFDCCFN